VNSNRFEQLYTYGLALYIPEGFSLELTPLAACGFPQQRFPGISNILGSPLQLRLYPHNSVLEHVFSMDEALSLIPSTGRERKGRKRRRSQISGEKPNFRRKAKFQSFKKDMEVKPC
jgi:hypothetical protein